ncbi:hypothetical protein AZ66_29250 [Paenibacillus sp. E194]|uniref:hypothetical protein n=1 Tax=Paenibacillus sp. E194 TaxID=1458845 RepID=UPI0005CA2B75|nr:hypothetical protein [Paenibacillus sp. E194]KJB84716.1 hypothetical protein AZ66_29250 [Paenibacillus sp. E194]
MKKKIIGGILAVLIVAIILQVPNNLRYKLESTFGNPHTYFYSVGVGMLLNEVGGAYDEEFSLDEQPSAHINLSQHSSSKVDLYLYGKYVNSADPLVVILNDKVIYNGQPEKEMVSFYSTDYIKKHFIVKLSVAIRNGNNKLVVSTGEATKQYNLMIVK